MKKSFKFLSLMISFVVLFSGVQSGFAANNTIYYDIVDNHAVVSCQMASLSGDIVIDSTYEGYPVTEFVEPEMAYIFSSGVTSITLPNSIDAEKLTGFPFCGCPDAKIILASDNTELLLEGNVLYNKDKTRLIRYQNNPNSKSFTIPESVLKVEKCAFASSSLEELTISNSATEFDCEYSFDYNSIKNVYFNGTQEQWNENNEKFGYSYSQLFEENATIHCLSNGSDSSSTDTTGFMALIVAFVNTTVVPLLTLLLDYISVLLSSLA